MDAAIISTWHICISGFLEREGQQTGIFSLWRHLQRKYANPATRVELRTWSDDWRGLADLIALAKNGSPPRVNLYGYSWGGAGAMRLAKELQKRGIDVFAAVLADPVYRHNYWLGQWRALVPWSRIAVPGNVGEVRCIYQRNSLPMGHELTLECAETMLHEPTFVEADHSHVDESNEFHRAAQAYALKLYREGIDCGS